MTKSGNWSRGRVWGIAFFLLGIWLLLFRVLAVHWSANPQYSYGWLVPVLAAYLAVVRWKMRPSPGNPVGIGSWISLAGAFFFFPTWVLLQPNPDWRSLSWIAGGEIASITIGMLLCIGGVPWARHFAFPICLIFTAVPWPRPLELPLIDRLTYWVTHVSVECLNLAGIRSLQQGNLIELRTGMLGVEEACSGIRSLQATLMMSLFLGELFRFKFRQRALLVGTGLAAALGTNILRTCFLAWIASDRGIEAVGGWHDRAADVALIGCFAGVWGFSFLLGPHGKIKAAAPNIAAPYPVPTNVLGGLAACFIATIALTEFWFHDFGQNPTPRWGVIPPPEGKSVAISPAVWDQLRFDVGSETTWPEPDGRDWLLYYFEWKPGPPRSRLMARLHNPQLCLSAAGMKLMADRGVILAEAEGFQLRFRAFTFESQGRTLFVYHCVHENRTARAEKMGALDDSIVTASLQAVAWRERNLGQQVVELAGFGYSSAAEADAALQRNIQRLLQRKQ